MNIIKTVLPTILALTLAACSDSPSVSQARAKLDDEIKENTHGLIKVVSFTKTDGVMHEMFGAKEYEMSFTTELEFLDDCMWSIGADMGTNNFRIVYLRALPNGPKTGADAYYATSMKPARKGERQKLSDTMTFQKTERGWH